MPGVAQEFTIVGFIGHLGVSARWHDGFLTADPELLDLAEAIVGSGLVFDAAGTALEVQSSLDEPLPAALTLIRCFDRITKSEMTIRNSDGTPDMRLEETAAE